jgi:hypothetical protein
MECAAIARRPGQAQAHCGNRIRSATRRESAFTMRAPEMAAIPSLFAVEALIDGSSWLWWRQMIRGNATAP